MVRPIMPSKALLKAVETFVNHNTAVDGHTAPFMFFGCDSGGHAFIRHSVIHSSIRPSVERCFIGFLTNTMYPPYDNDNDEVSCPQLCTLINYMFQFDKSLACVRDLIKSEKDFEYVLKNTVPTLQKIQDFLFYELERQFRIYNASK